MGRLKVSSKPPWNLSGQAVICGGRGARGTRQACACEKGLARVHPAVAHAGKQGSTAACATVSQGTLSTPPGVTPRMLRCAAALRTRTRLELRKARIDADVESDFCRARGHMRGGGGHGCGLHAKPLRQQQLAPPEPPLPGCLPHPSRSASGSLFSSSSAGPRLKQMPPTGQTSGRFGGRHTSGRAARAGRAAPPMHARHAPQSAPPPRKPLPAAPGCNAQMPMLLLRISSSKA